MAAQHSEATERVAIENVTHPGKRTEVDGAMYRAMREALLRVLPPHAPGLTREEYHHAVIPHLPQELYPEGAKSGWWSKALQLDLEAKGEIARERTTPLRWHRTGSDVARRPGGD